MNLNLSIQNQKVQKRAWFQEKLLKEKQGSCEDVQKYAHIFQWPKESVIASYYPILKEVDLRFLHDTYSNIVYPRMKNKEIEFVLSNPYQQKFSKKSLFYEPPASSKVCALADIDVFLVPAIAFDRRGVRLGRGQGFYDRVLCQKSPHSQVIGVSWSIQVDTDLLPQDERDQNVDAILTEKFVLLTKQFKKGV